MEEGGRERVPLKLILACCPLPLEHGIALKLNHGAMLSMGHSKHRETGWGLSGALLWSHTAHAYPALQCKHTAAISTNPGGRTVCGSFIRKCWRSAGLGTDRDIKDEAVNQAKASFHGALQRAKRSLSQGTRLMAEASRVSSRKPWRDVPQVLKGTVLTLEFYTQLSYLLNEGGNWS